LGLDFLTQLKGLQGNAQAIDSRSASVDLPAAERALQELASVFLQQQSLLSSDAAQFPNFSDLAAAFEAPSPNMEAKYRALVEQIPAVVFMAYLDKGIGEAYVNPQIEEALGFSQREWLEDPVRWYQQIHPEDKVRWSTEAAEMFLSGKPLRSSYRVVARDGRVLWFQCEAKMIRREDGQPWFIHGVGVDVTELKQAERALHQERNLLSAILDTVGALVVVLDRQGRVIQFNRACEELTGYTFNEAQGKPIWELFLAPVEIEEFKLLFEKICEKAERAEYESCWIRYDGSPRTIAWSAAVLPGDQQTTNYVIASGIDISERKRLERTILKISEREQRRIGQDLHDGLGQHLTGIAFMSKVLQEKLTEESMPESTDAAKIVKLVNDAIRKTKELSRGLLPVVSEENGLMSALRQRAGELEDLFQIRCQFECEEPVLIGDVNVATHLYHIAQEAVNNAIRHGKSRTILIRLAGKDGTGELSIKDDGDGFPKHPTTQPGVGLSIMNYRAVMIGGSLKVQPNQNRGVTVNCKFPLRNVE
jgi:PAS domain S-box-containing protein